MKPFPIPVVALHVSPRSPSTAPAPRGGEQLSWERPGDSCFGPGSQVEDETLDYIAMPRGMDTFRAPVLPEAPEIAQCALAQRTLADALAALDKTRHDGVARRIGLHELTGADRALVDQVLGEGEVSARVAGCDGDELRVQESVFAGVWRVMRFARGALVEDWIEVGALPQALRDAAHADASRARLPALPQPLPEGVMNAPMLLSEIEDQWLAWQPGRPAHVVNLTLLPMGPADIGFLDQVLGTGRVLILSRGYGNCRIANTQSPNCWRVVYYNSQDAVILDTVEVVDVPEVACAAPEDLHDSHERLREVLEWIEGAVEPQAASA